MAEIRKNESLNHDFKERFEFKLTVGDNIICQRYFKINNFNPECIKSFELADTIRGCARLIDEDLKSKTAIYLDIYAPRTFSSVEEMNEYFSVEEHRNEMRLGTGIVIKDEKNTNYVWGLNGPMVVAVKFDENGEFTNNLTSEDYVEYKLTFYDNAAFDSEGKIITYVNEYGVRVPRLNTSNPRVLCTTSWTGIYPKYVRNSIDLSNKKGRLQEDDDITRLSLDRYILYKMVEGRTDLVWTIIKNICTTCSSDSNTVWTTSYEDYVTDAHLQSEAYKAYNAYNTGE